MSAADLTTILTQRPILSAETPRELEDTLSPAARAVFAQAPSAATAAAEKLGVFHHAEATASVAGADSMAVVAAVITGNRSFKFPGSLKDFRNGGRTNAPDRAKCQTFSL